MPMIVIYRICSFSSSVYISFISFNIQTKLTWVCSKLSYEVSEWEDSSRADGIFWKFCRKIAMFIIDTLTSKTSDLKTDDAPFSSTKPFSQCFDQHEKLLVIYSVRCSKTCRCDKISKSNDFASKSKPIHSIFPPFLFLCYFLFNPLGFICLNFVSNMRKFA